jgi:hypothetical protein
VSSPIFATRESDRRARRSCPATHPTKSVAGKLYREISILMIPNRQELSIRGPSAAA